MSAEYIMVLILLFTENVHFNGVLFSLVINILPSVSTSLILRIPTFQLLTKNKSTIAYLFLDILLTRRPDATQQRKV